MSVTFIFNRIKKRKIKDDDEITRFIVRRRDIRQDYTIRHTSFMPYIPKGKKLFELSLYCTSNMKNYEVWQNLAVLLKNKPKGRGILQAKHFFSNKLRIKHTPKIHPRHYDAVDWSTEKDEQMLIAKKLSLAASFDQIPNSN